MSVSNGQLANQTTFNAAFQSRTVDTDTVGKVDLNNAAAASGDPVVNVQREINSLDSFTGRTSGSAKDALPSWSSNETGTSTDNLEQRAEALDAEFNSSTGHAHSGAAGDGAPIDATDLTGILPIANGGTGSATQNFVDLTTGQSVGGNKSFTGSTTVVDIEATTSIKIQDPGAGTNKVTLQAPTLAGDYTLTLPVDDGTPNQILKTDGSGVLSWTTPASASPLTTKGDVYTYTTVDARLAVGTNNQVLAANSATATGLEWQTFSAALLAVTSKTANYTATTADNVILCDSTSAAFTITLYTAAGNTGRKLIIKKTDSSVNAVTIDGDGSETIDGSTTTTLNTQNETLVIFSDGTNWQIEERRIPSAWATDTGFSTAGPTTSSTSFKSRRVGDSLEVLGKLTFSGAGAGAISVTLAGSRTIDTAKLMTLVTNQTPLDGRASLYDISAVTSYLTMPTYNAADTMRFYNTTGATGSTNGGATGAAQPITIANTDTLEFFVRLPITGWNG